MQALNDFISQETGYPKAAWIENADMHYLYQQALQFRENRPGFARNILEICEDRIKDAKEVKSLKRTIEDLWRQAERKKEAASDLYIAQAIEILANDYWLLHEMRSQGAGEGNLLLLKETIVNDSIEVGKRLFKNASRKIQARISDSEKLDQSKVKPLSEWVRDGSFAVNNNLSIPYDAKRIHLIINAGRSTRVRTTIPKGIIYLGGKPLIQHTIDAGRAAGFEKTLVVLGFKKSINEAFLKKDVVSALQPTVEGTAHAVMSVFPALKNFRGTMLVSYSDMPFLRGETLRSLYEKHITNGALMTILTTSRLKRPEFGRLLTDEHGHYQRIAQVRIEDAEANQVDAGFYCFKCPEFWEYLERISNHNNRYEYYLTDIMNEISQSGGAILGNETESKIETYGINRPNELIKAFEIGYHLYHKGRSLTHLDDCLNQYSQDFEQDVLNFYRQFQVPSALGRHPNDYSIQYIENLLSRQIGALFYY